MKYFATRNVDSHETEAINSQVSHYKADTLIRNKYMTYEYDLHESEEKGRAKAKLEMVDAMLATAVRPRGPLLSLICDFLGHQILAYGIAPFHIVVAINEIAR